MYSGYGKTYNPRFKIGDMVKLYVEGDRGQYNVSYWQKYHRQHNQYNPHKVVNVKMHEGNHDYQLILLEGHDHWIGADRFVPVVTEHFEEDMFKL